VPTNERAAAEGRRTSCRSRRSVPGSACARAAQTPWHKGQQTRARAETHSLVVLVFRASQLQPSAFSPDEQRAGAADDGSRTCEHAHMQQHAQPITAVHTCHRCRCVRKLPNPERRRHQPAPSPNPLPPHQGPHTLQTLSRQSRRAAPTRRTWVTALRACEGK
jgi:hypothetical protein